MEDLKTGNGAPYAASPAVRGDGEDDSERRCTAEREAQLGRVARRPPHHAEVVVLPTAAVVLASRERTARVIRIANLARLARAGEVDEGGLTALEEAVGDAGVGAEDVGRVGGEPGGLGDGEDVLAAF